MLQPQRRSEGGRARARIPGWIAGASAACLAAASVTAGCNLLTGAGNLVVEDSGQGGSGTGATGSGATHESGAGASGTSGTSGHTTGASTSSGSTSSGQTTSTGTVTLMTTSSSTSSSSSSTSSGSTDPAQHCVDTINGYRATLGLPPYTRWTANEACVAEEATTDEGKMSAHWSFINQMMCGSNAEDECPGYADNPLTANDGIDTCLALMWAEKNQSECSGCATCDFPYTNCTDCVFDSGGVECGHYLNMKSSVLSTVACGFSTVGWYAQDFK